MRKPIGLIFLSAALALGSGTVTPGARPGGAKCATSSIEGVIAKVDAAGKMFSVRGANAKRDFKVAPYTVFRVPGASQDDLKNAPLSKVSAHDRVKVFYCSKDGTPVEVKVER